MASQPLTGHTSTPQLHGYLKGIEDEFGRLNHELDETRKQRDEFITKYKSQAKELRALRQNIAGRERCIICQYCQGEIADTCGVTDDNPFLLSPVSSSSEHYPCLEGEDASGLLDNTENSKDIGQLERERNQDDVRDSDGSNRNQNTISVEPTIAGLGPLSLESNLTSSTNGPGYSAWQFEFNSDATAAQNLNLVYKLTQKGRIRLTFSMDGKYLATASGLGVVSIFDLKTGKRITVMKDPYQEGKALPCYECIGFGPDSKLLATGESDGTVRIWIIPQRRVRNIFKHGSYVYALNFSPNGQYIATCSANWTVRIWRLRDGFSRVLTCFQFIPRSVRFSADGRFVASGCGHPYQMLIWEVGTGKLVARWRGHPNVVTSLVFTPGGKGLLSASWDKTVIHWDVASLQSLGKAHLPSSDMVEISRLVGHTDYINTISISPDGKLIASGSRDKTVRIWNARDATLHCILHCPGKVWSVEFSPVGNYVAIGGDLGEVAIWNYADL